MDEVCDVFERACSESDLVMITAEYANYLPEEELARAQARLSPLVVLVPDICGRVALPDLARRLRARLGVEA